MKTLFLDTSSFFVNVTILTGNDITTKYIEKNDNKLSDRIFDIIEKEFQTANIKSKEIERIFVVNGPGSFTGIRIGLTIAKTMAWALKIPVYTVSSLEMMISGANEDAIALIKDRNNHVYYGSYDSNLNKLENDKFIELKKIESNNIYSYDEFEIESKKPIIDVIKVIKKHESDTAINPHLLAPNYLKQTDAEKSVSLD